MTQRAKRIALLLAVLVLTLGAGCGDAAVEGDLLVTADRVFEGRELIGDPFADLDRLEVPRLVVARGDVVVENGRQIVPGG